MGHRRGWGGGTRVFCGAAGCSVVWRRRGAAGRAATRRSTCPLYHTSHTPLAPLFLPTSQWKEAVANGTVNQAAATPSYDVSSEKAPVGEALSFGQLMAFSGPAPELINGRLAM